MTRPIILIIDDEPTVQISIESILADEGYDLYFAPNGAEGLNMAARLTPDVILLDVMMPGMDGFAVCQRLRATESLVEIPILLVTALDDREAKLTALSAGADDFLTKPVDRYELRARLRTITRLDRYRKLYSQRDQLEQAHKSLQFAYDQTIEGWTRAIDIHDKETQGHSQRVTKLTLALAQLAGFSYEEISFIRWGALLHDVGKLGIPDVLLHKKGSLTAEEWDLIKKHPVFAYEMLSPIIYLRPSLDIPYCHHEKWDGSGYPRGLRAEQIPLTARIFAVIDVWDALHSDRPYRKGLSEDETLAYIQKNAGAHFDPAVVELFFAHFKTLYKK